MTPADQDRADRAHTRAETDIARHLTGRLASGIDPTHTARQILALMVDLHWRHVPPAPTIPTGRGDPPNAVFLAAKQTLTPTQPPPAPQ